MNFFSKNQFLLIGAVCLRAGFGAGKLRAFIPILTLLLEGLTKVRC
jgi:hypothetical protein